MLFAYLLTAQAQPELVSKTALTWLFTVALLLGFATLIVAIRNGIVVRERVRVASPVRGTDTYIVAAAMRRGAAAAVVISLAFITFTAQALAATRAGTFGLTNNWFSLSFISIIYIPLMVRLTLSLLENRDRKMLEQTR